MIMTRTANRARRGFTLTEAAIVLGIVGLILGAIWVAAASVYNNIRVNDTSRQVLTIAQNVRSLYGTSSVMDAATTASLCSAGVFPADMNLNCAAGAGGTIAADIWGGAVDVAQTTFNGVVGAAFTITYRAVPQDACIKLATTTTGPARDTGLVGLAGAAATATTFPVTPANAITSPCATTGTAGNTMVWTFRLKA